jgi:hypothetical protein
MTGIATTHNFLHDRIIANDGIDDTARGTFQVKGHGRCQHLDVGNFFRSGVHQHIAVTHRSTGVPGLKQILQADANLAFNTTDSLLQCPGKLRVGFVDPYFVLKLLVVIKYKSGIKLKGGLYAALFTGSAP